MTAEFFRRPRTYLIGIPILVLLAVTVGPFVYIHFIEADPPKPLTLDSAKTTTTGNTATSGKTTATATSAGAASSLDGTWKATTGSTVGYRVNEVLFGQNNTAVGRTTAVTGRLALSGTTASTASFTADLTKVTSDKGMRDNQFRGRIMDTASHPTATFTLTKPIALTNIPDNGIKIDVKATGDLTLKGTKRSVSFAISAKRDGDKIEASGQIPVVFADYGIDNPSGGPANTEDHGLLEFLVVFAKS